MLRHFSVIVFAALVSSSGLMAETPTVSMPAGHRALLESHCTKCHNADKQKGRVRLDDLSFTITGIETAERWQKILDALNAGEMPPEDEEPLPDTAKTEFLDDLANTLVTARVAGRSKRRDHHVAVESAGIELIRELLGVEVRSATPVGHRIGQLRYGRCESVHVGDQFEQYLTLGRKALDAAFARELAATEERYWRYETEAISER